MPNLYVVLVLFVGLFIGKKIGVVAGIIIGLILDALFGRDVGITSILLGAVGLAAEFLDRRYSKDSRITIVIMAIVATVFFEVVKYAICYFMHGIELEIMEFVRILLIENLFNSLLIIIVYAGMKKLGYYLEEGFKTKKFATRYF
jgi:rod shape-determining protein MreD